MPGLDELDQALKGIAKALQQMVGRRMVLAQLRQDLARLAVGVDFPGDAVELRLVLVQVRIADLQQPG